jgi:acyl-coenzyme A thioesterase PaaI-like protein
MNETSYMITRERAVEILREDLPAWVQDLGLVVGEVGGFHASLRLPWNLNHSRDGKQVSTSALVAAADSAAMVAVCSARGGYLPMTAIQQSTSFFHPVLNQDVLVHAGVTRLDEDFAFTHVSLLPAGSSEPAAQSSAVYHIGRWSPS